MQLFLSFPKFIFCLIILLLKTFLLILFLVQVFDMLLIICNLLLIPINSLLEFLFLFLKFFLYFRYLLIPAFDNSLKLYSGCLCPIFKLLVFLLYFDYQLPEIGLSVMVVFKLNDPLLKLINDRIFLKDGRYSPLLELLQLILKFII